MKTTPLVDVDEMRRPLLLMLTLLKLNVASHNFFTHIPHSALVGTFTPQASSPKFLLLNVGKPVKHVDSADGL